MTFIGSDPSPALETDAATPSVKYNSHTNTFWTEFDMKNRPVSEAVVAVVAQVREQDPIDLPPLYESVETDALNALLAATIHKSDRSEVEVSFEYAGHQVTVDNHGTVEVSDLESGEIS